MAETVLSVKKIKKFRLQPRAQAVMRNLRALSENAQATPELEKAVETEIRAVAGLLETAALYATFAPDACPPGLTSVRAAEGERPPLSLTLFAATVGVGLEEEIARTLSRGEALRSRVLTALGEELADQSAQFVARLVNEEAKDDAFELSDRRPLASMDEQKTLLNTLDAARIPLSFDAGGHLTPRFSRLGYVLWWPPSKKRS